MTKNQKEDRTNEHERVSRWEWIVAAIGVLCFVLVAGYFAREAIRGERGAPDVIVRLDSVNKQNAGYLAHFEARNTGGSTALGVHVEAELSVGDSVVERAELVIDYLAPASVKRGGFFFTRDPGAGQLRARAVGFIRP